METLSTLSETDGTNALHCGYLPPNRFLYIWFGGDTSVSPRRLRNVQLQLYEDLSDHVKVS